jgi:MscS family membrane protein
MMKHLRTGLVMAFAVWVFVGAAWAGDNAFHPLSPADTSSPKATLSSFLENAREAYLLTSKTRASFLASGRSRLTADELEQVKQIYAHLKRAAQCIDLSKVPAAFLSHQAPETVVLLKEILDRLEIPPIDEWPTTGSKAETKFKKWRIPSTEISIYRVSEGLRAGEYLFAPETVQNAKTYYNVVKQLPYKESTTIGWYEEYIGNPKGLRVYAVMPLRWLFNLPDWAKWRVFDQALWQWLSLVIAVGLGTAIIYLFHRIGRYWRGRNPDSTFGFLWIRVIELAAVIAILRGLGFTAEALGISVGYHQSLYILLWSISTIMVAWLAWVIASAIAETMIVSQGLRTGSINGQLLRLSFRLIAVMMVSAVLVEGANQLGLPSYSILTGLGVGGLAVALAARETLANLFGSLVIMVERPFTVGDFIQVDTDRGFVESVGFRSTRIRTFDDSLISIPSSKLIAATVDNLGARNYRRVRTILGITYGTPTDKLETFIKGIKDIIRNHPKTRKDRFFVAFHDYGQHSLDILVDLYLNVPDRLAELTEREGILLQIARLAEEVQVEFAFPTQTVHVGSLPIVSKERNKQAAKGRRRVPSS